MIAVREYGIYGRTKGRRSMNNNTKMLSLAALCVLLTLQQAFASTAVTGLTDIDGGSAIVLVCVVAGLFAILRAQAGKNRR